MNEVESLKNRVLGSVAPEFFIESLRRPSLMTSANGVNRESLLATNEEYRRLHEEHLDLGTRIKALSDKPVLTDAEQVEEIRLKKLKLAGRDRMEEIARAAH